MTEPAQQMAVVDEGVAYDTMALMPRNMQQAKEFAAELAKSTLIPKHLQGKPGDCLMVTMQAYRWRMDPFVVANCTSVQHGKMMYEGKLVYAALKSLNAIEGRLKFEITGDGQNSAIKITGTPRGGESQSISGTVKGWRTYQKDKETGQPIQNNWDKDPQSQLVYRGTRQWARLFAPEAVLGVYCPEDDFDDDTPVTAVVTQDVPTLKKAAPIEDGDVTDPTPAAAKQSPASQRPPSSPAPAPTSSTPEVRPGPNGPEDMAARTAARQAAAKPAKAAPAAAPAPRAAPAAATQGDELFDDPTPAGEATAQAAPEAPAADEPHTGEPGDPLTDAMGRVIESARTNSKLTKAQLDAKFPNGIGKGNINDALAWIRSKAQ